MIRKKLEISDAWDIANRLPWAWVVQGDGVALGENQLSASDKVQEARIFGGEAEIHFYRENGALQAVLTQEEPGDVVAEECTELLPGFGRELKKLRILGFDEDGQAFCRAMRLAGWKG